MRYYSSCSFFNLIEESIVIWSPCNIYPSALLGKNISIGAFSEIGGNVEIGDGSRVGAMCFIPEGVKIGKNCFIGPKCCFMNDIRPSLNRKDWRLLYTVIEDNVVIGANCSILPGVTIGEGAFIGAASLVTKDVPAREKWFGSPAIKR